LSPLIMDGHGCSCSWTHQQRNHSWSLLLWWNRDLHRLLRLLLFLTDDIQLLRSSQIRILKYFCAQISQYSRQITGQFFVLPLNTILVLIQILNALFLRVIHFFLFLYSIAGFLYPILQFLVKKLNFLFHQFFNCHFIYFHHQFKDHAI
jgi:hypothetical protein